jgi:hypothetical protein
VGGIESESKDEFFSSILGDFFPAVLFISQIMINPVKTMIILLSNTRFDLQGYRRVEYKFFNLVLNLVVAF